MADLLGTLRSRFGHQQFRDGQASLVRAVLEGGDVLAVMPTGSGKSLCYQLPALMLDGTMIVVSPLISLMKDQVDELTRRRIAGAALHSMLAADRRRDVLRRARAGELGLLYVAPERFASDEFMQVLRELLAARDAFDFDQAFGSEDRLTQAVTLFALLEMHKRGEATWAQGETFGPIRIESG